MRKFFYALCTLAVLAVSSCLDSKDDESTYYDDTAITAFTMGTLNRYRHTTSATGTDSIYKTTLTGSTYAMTIDQLKCEIYNKDSLPEGTDVAHVVVTTLSTKNSGVVLIKSATSDSLAYYSTSDSINFSTPRIFRVYSSSGTSYRDYTVTLNVKQTTKSDTLQWTSTAQSEDMAALEGLKAVCLNGRLMVFGQKDGATTALASADGATWSPPTFNLSHPLSADAWRSAVVLNDRVFLLDGSTLVSSTDGQNWETVLAATDLKQLVGAGTQELFALATDGRLTVSKDGGLTWATETIDDDAALLPTENVTAVSWPFQAATQTDYVLLTGSRDDTQVVWRKLSEYASETATPQWIYMTPADNNRYRLAVGECQTLVYRAPAVLAIAPTGIKTSRDMGLTWKNSGSYQLPAGFSATSVAAVTDDEGRLWLMGSGSGQVWCCAANE